MRLSLGEGDTHTPHSALVPMSGAVQSFLSSKSPFSPKGALQQEALGKLMHKYPFSIMTSACVQKRINSQFFLKTHASPSGKAGRSQRPWLEATCLSPAVPSPLSPGWRAPAHTSLLPFFHNSQFSHRGCEGLDQSQGFQVGSKESNSRLIFRGT